MATHSSVSLRPGEECLEEPLWLEENARLCFIGRVRTPWGPEDCPGNIAAARATGQGARIELADGMERGLVGLSVGQPMVAVYWMDHARRDLIVQAPRHCDGPRGTFALRSPHRPNPIALSVVTIRAIDAAAGVLEIDALDCFDGTPLLDLKPWLPTVDAPHREQTE
ncbi:TrmO family methyltransferase domain-containing protein [Tropicimonas isoalkanivorans]|uniref:tRNA-Thr(GGU) m(6)t(6)A37 methyltransferase TsaA n=1 Tax=Tropicimonas isoalkanivorans TaxID=441112 RepID=A0A1I1D967_9RHOB|nr:TrmO family methyltransferase [Tropicimonas isoalkanivorans]SFB70876.1 tRNA-Thr(GGU) m(6)t(6)A37 methyltransferase TsaA [Tropicimonas isoalkanivorans]